MLYKNRIVERRSSQFGIITYRLLTCFCFLSVRMLYVFAVVKEVQRNWIMKLP